MKNPIPIKQTALSFSKFLFLFLLSPLAGMAQTTLLGGDSPGDDGGTAGSSCNEPIYIAYDQQELITFAEGQQTAWLLFETGEGTSVQLDFIKNNTSASAQVESVSLYIGNNCEMQFVEQKTAPFYAMLQYMNESLESSTSYLLEVERLEVHEEGLPEQYMNLSVQRPILFPCTTSTFSPCKRIKNGDLQNVAYYAINGLVYSSSCSFATSGSCDWTGINQFNIRSESLFNDSVIWGQLVTNWGHGYADPNDPSVPYFEPGVAIAQVDIEANKNYYFSLELREGNGTYTGTKQLPDKFTVKLINTNDPAYGCNFGDLSTMPSKVVYQTTNLSSLVGTSNASYYDGFVKFSEVFNSGSGNYNRLIIYAEDLPPNYAAFPQMPNIYFDNLVLSDLPSAGEDKFLVCENSTVLGNKGCPGKTISYSWSPSGNLDNPTWSNPTYTTSGAGTTTLTMTGTLTEGGNNYVFTDQVDVTKTTQSAYTDVTVLNGWDIADASNVYSFEIPNINGNYSSNGYNFYIEGDFIINADFSMTNCNLLMAPGAKIIVNNGATFTFNGDAVNKNNFIKGCGSMWDGIELTDVTSGIYINNAYPFSDATNGITVSPKNTVSIRDNHFDMNNRVLNVSGVDSNNDLFEFKDNTVECTAYLGSSGSYYWPSNSIVFKDGDVNTYLQGNDVIYNNTFYGSGGNIYIENFRPLNISSNVFAGFNDMLFGFPNPITKPTRAISIYADIVTYNMGIGLEKNRFLNCKIAIESNGVANLGIVDNFININADGSTHPVNSEKCAFLVINNNNYPSYVFAERNEGRNLSDGIIITNHFGRNLIIDENDFNLNLNSNSIGIKVSFNGQEISSYLPRITRNTIKNANVGVLVQGADVIGMKIIDNTFFDLVHNVCPAFPNWDPNCIPGSFGIKVQNGYYYIQGNSISFPDPLKNANAVGISIANSKYEITCNYVENSGSAVIFQNLNFPFNTYNYDYQLDENVFHDSYLGLVLSNFGSFDYIGTSSNYVENTWSYSYYLPPVSTTTSGHAYSETYATNNSDGSLSEMYNSPIPTINKKNGSSSYPIAPNPLGSSGYSPGCSAPTSSPMMMGGGQILYTASTIGGTGLDSTNSAKSFWKSPQFRDRNKFVAHTDSFAHFELQRFYIEYKIDSAMQADVALTMVYDSLETTPLGKSIDGKNGFSFATAHPFDMEYKTINRIYDDYMSNDSLSSIDSNAARTIAASCPYYKGMAVYKARNLMSLLGEYHFINECEMVKTPSSSSFQRLKLDGAEEDGIQLYPNPSSGIFQVKLPSEMENAEISVYNMQGVLVKQQRIDKQSTLDLSELNNGIYLYRIIQNGNSIHTGKLQLLK